MSISIYSIAAELKSIYLKEPTRNSETAEIIKRSIDSAEIKKMIRESIKMKQ